MENLNTSKELLDHLMILLRNYDNNIRKIVQQLFVQWIFDPRISYYESLQKLLRFCIKNLSFGTRNDILKLGKTLKTKIKNNHSDTIINLYNFFQENYNNKKYNSETLCSISEKFSAMIEMHSYVLDLKGMLQTDYKNSSSEENNLRIFIISKLKELNPKLFKDDELCTTMSYIILRDIRKISSNIF